MTTLESRLVERDEQPFPGLAHVRLREADGTVVDIWDKMPVLGVSTYAQLDDPIPLDCEVVEEGPTSTTVRLLHGVEAIGGRDTLVVARELLGR